MFFCGMQGGNYSLHHYEDIVSSLSFCSFLQLQPQSIHPATPFSLFVCHWLMHLRFLLFVLQLVVPLVESSGNVAMGSNSCDDTFHHWRRISSYILRMLRLLLTHWLSVLHQIMSKLFHTLSHCLFRSFRCMFFCSMHHIKYVHCRDPRLKLKYLIWCFGA